MLMLRRFHEHWSGKHEKAVRFDSRPNAPNAFRWEDRLLVLVLIGLILGYLILISYPSSGCSDSQEKDGILNLAWLNDSNPSVFSTVNED